MMGVVNLKQTNFSNLPDSNQLQKAFTRPVASYCDWDNKFQLVAV